MVPWYTYRGEGYSKSPRHGNGGAKAFRPLCSALPIINAV